MQRAKVVATMDKIEIKVNGAKTEIAAPQTVAAFIESLGKNPKRCVVELNGRAFNYAGFKDTVLADGDILEIMAVVAGG